jgi:RNA polymerase sigma-B factor
VAATATERWTSITAATRAETTRLVDGRDTLRQLQADRTALLARARQLVRLVRLQRDAAVVDLTLPKMHRASARDREIWQLHIAYARRRDSSTLDSLVTIYLPRAERLARAGTRRLDDLDDRMQVAREALVIALRRFDPSRGIPFQAFADATIAGQLHKHIRDHGWLLRAPRRVHELIPAIRAETERLSQQLGRTPVPDEIAAQLGCDVDDVLMALTAHHARTHESLDVFVDGELPAYERHGQPEPLMRVVDDRDALRRALATISSEDRILVRDYFVTGKTQQEIADELGRSQMHVSRRLRHVLRLLATRMTQPDRVA